MLVYTAGIGVKLLLVVLEAQSKTPYLKVTYRDLSPEVTSGIINKALFWWINSLLKVGYRGLLSYNDLPALDDGLSSEHLRLKLQNEWDGRSKIPPLKLYLILNSDSLFLLAANSKSKNSLLFATLRCLRQPLLSVVFPRMCLIVLGFAQPFLITYAISYVSETTIESHTDSVGYELISASVVIYIGIAVNILLSLILYITYGI